MAAEMVLGRKLEVRSRGNVELHVDHEPSPSPDQADSSTVDGEASKILGSLRRSSFS
jgi:hypothetical protein